MDKLSVIIPTKDREEEVIKCVDSLLVQTHLPDEILTVDGSQVQKLADILKAQFPKESRIKHVPSLPGLTRQRNVGIKASAGDIILFLDDDTILEPEYIKEMMSVFASYPPDKIGGVSGELINVHNTNTERFFSPVAQFIKRMFFLTIFRDGKFQPSGFATTIRSGTTDKVTEVEFLYGFNMAFRKKIFDEFQFDENMYERIGMEDEDIAYRVSRKYQNVYNPRARLVHTYTRTTRSRFTRGKATFINHHYLFRKNLPQTLKNKMAYYWSAIGLFVRESMIMVTEGDTTGMRGLLSGLFHLMRGKGIKVQR